ncbi:MAG TPA: hypothetical protein VM925_17375 [Labilithrix sp.]|nr:hypothetical protein [Labilithrix sp.]
MNKRGIIGWATFFMFVFFVIACRQGEPTGDPKTPSNRPLPEIDRTEKDPKASPTPFVGDAG